MAILSTTRIFLAAALLSGACAAQTTPTQNPPAAPCPTADQGQSQNPSPPAKPCIAPDAKKPSAAQQFPFPGTPANSPAPPDSPNPSTTTPSSAAKEHPFPTTPAPALPGDDSSSSSSSSSDDPNADSEAPLPRDTGAEGTSVHRKLPKPVHVQSDDERVDEDLKVAMFYMHDDNLPGAYLRAKDAVKVQPDYSAAHFALAEIAQKMKKKDEAIAEFETYLKLDPDGEKAKAAHRALADLK